MEGDEIQRPLFANFNIEELACYTIKNCQPVDPHRFFFKVYVIMHFFVTFLTVVTSATGIVHIREVFLFLFGIGLWVDGFLNRLLSTIIFNISLAPPLCGTLNEDTPSFVVQRAMFFYTVYITHSIFYRRFQYIWHMFLISFLPTLVAAAQLSLHYNTILAVILGGVFGTLNGIFFQLIVYYIIYPIGRRLVDTILGYNYDPISYMVDWTLQMVWYNNTWADPVGHETMLNELVYGEYQHPEMKKFNSALQYPVCDDGGFYSFLEIM